MKRYWHVRTGTEAATLRELYRDCCTMPAERDLSEEFFSRYARGEGLGGLTAITGIRQHPSGPLAAAEAIATGEMSGTSLEHALRDAVSNLPQEVAVAVSGGIDSWLLVMLLRQAGHVVRAFYLESGVPGYCEREQVEHLANALDTECEYLRVTATDFVTFARDFVDTTECPIYNLHPVSKLLFAKALRARGIRSIVTGDGADQVLRREWDCDLLPLTVQCFEQRGVRLIAPFLSPQLLRLCGRAYADKQPVRALAARLGVPELLKRPTMFPAMPLPGGVNCLTYTADLLIELLETYRCAALPALSATKG